MSVDDLFTPRAPVPFTREQAETLVGKTVSKAQLTPENPGVPISARGTVISAEESDLAEGWAVVVDWGRGDIWIYDDWLIFSKDTSLE